MRGASPTSRTTPARSRGSTPCTTRRTGRSTCGELQADVLLCSPYKFFGPHLGLATVRAELAAQWRTYKVRPATHPFETGTLAHELLAGFVAAVEYIDSIGWPRSRRTSARSGSSSSTACPTAARSTACRRWTAACRRSRSTSTGTSPRAVAERARRAGHRGLGRRLLRRRDHAAARPRRRRRRPRRHRPLQHRGGGRPPPRRAGGAVIDPVELLRDLIRFDTTNPPGNEEACVAFVEALLREHGIESERYEKAPGRPNLIARHAGSNGGTAAHALRARRRRDDRRPAVDAAAVRRRARRRLRLGPRRARHEERRRDVHRGVRRRARVGLADAARSS